MTIIICLSEAYTSECKNGNLDNNCMSNVLRNLIYIIAISCVLVIIVLSLLPAQEMYRTSLPKSGEHFVAYWGAGVLMGLAFRGRWHRRGVILAGLVAMAGVLELLQQISPGRSLHLSDFLASAAGAMVGIVMIGVVFRYALLRSGCGEERC